MRLRNIPEAKKAILNSPYVIQKPEEKKGSWDGVFPEKKPLHMEVGMGKGRFLMDMARLHPDINYLGVEMYDSVLYRAIQKMEEQEALPNLLFLCVDARLLPDLFGKGEIDRIYLNFSDPWPKARHAKRRLTSGEFLERYAAILLPGCLLEFKTDNRELFEFSLEEIRQSETFSLVSFTYDLHRDEVLCAGNVMTEYEEKFSAMGNPIYKLTASRN
ncbi:MAG: tRNA (guanosine(46)-N7)-methyltransferase TrmB [Blautia sp.]|jgi:tRNA (guanine-N7-)-methyltransferase